MQSVSPNMKKIFLQISLLIILFFSVLGALNQVDWMRLFRVEKITKSTEKKLGDMFWNLYHSSKDEINNDSAHRIIDSLLTRICTSNKIERSTIKLHIVQSTEINAFALPDQHLVINTALIESCQNEMELCGVVAHEMAHMQLDHVMKKLIKEIGLSVLISITTGNAGAEKINEVIKLLTSSAYDRKLEKQADITAVDYLENSTINPAEFANFLARLGQKETTSSQYLSWINTHPDSKERAKYILAHCNKMAVKAKPVLAADSFSQLKKLLQLQKKE
jgi:beta-barrel assembly-enhancing protease